MTYLSGPPAFTALLPAYPELRPAPPEAAETVAALCGGGRVDAIGDPGPGLAGRYRVEPDSGEPVFCKVFPDEIAGLQAHANRVAVHLANAGVSTIIALDEEPLPLDGLYALRFPYVDARFSVLSPDETYAVGALLASAHAALASFPGAAEVKATAERMDERLRGAAAEAEDELTRWAAETYFHPEPAIRRQPQTIHGDCNYTNVLFRRAGGEPCLIDFEESLAAWFDPVFDVAVATQRFALVAGPEAGALAEALVAGYGGAPDGLARACEETVARSVLVLAAKVAEGFDLPPAEREKFVELRSLVGAHRNLLGRLS